MHCTKITKLAKGWSSYVWLIKDRTGKKFVLKEVREKSPRKNLAEREGKMLLLANSVGVGPRVIKIDYKKNQVTMEYVNGEKLIDWIFSTEFDEEVTKEQLWKFLKQLYKQLIALDSIYLSHNQLQVGKNILVKESTNKKGENEFWPVIIDFEKASIKQNNHTKNIGQIESFLFYNPHGTVAKKIREKLETGL